MTEAERFRTLGHKMIDQLADYLDGAARRQGPVLPWRDPADALAEWPADFPADGTGDSAAFLARVLDGSIHLHHPRYVGHQVSAPRPETALWDLVSALLNNGMAVYEMGPAATAMERSVLGWLAEGLGLPASSEGVLTSGGSIGNLTALLTMRQARAGFPVWTDGAHAGPPLAVLVGASAHYSIARATQIMGWGSAGAVPIPVDDRYRMRPEALPDALADAERSGRRVIGVVASAASTATGAYDPLGPIADFCQTRGLWLHVDGAHGAAAAFSRRHRDRVVGIERADSVVLDAHKLLGQPALVTAVLFRDGRGSYAALENEASYLYHGREPRWWDIGLRTIECTKRMAALKLYATLALGGTNAIGAAVDYTFELAQRFAAALERQPDFEVIAPECNIVCFRHRPAGLDASALDRRQEAVRLALIRGGHFYLVQTKLDGKVWLRTALMNPATEDADLGALIDAIRAQPA